MNCSKFFRSVLTVFFTSALLLMTGCGGGGGGGGGDGDGGGGGGSDPGTSTGNGRATIGPDGGTIEITNPENLLYGVKVKIPEGALTEEIDIQVRALEVVPLEYGIIDSTVISFEPSGTFFRKPVTVTKPIRENLTGDDHVLVKLNLGDGNYWPTPNNVVVDWGNRTLNFDLYHFSEYSDLPLRDVFPLYLQDEEVEALIRLMTVFETLDSYTSWIEVIDELRVIESALAAAVYDIYQNPFIGLLREMIFLLSPHHLILVSIEKAIECAHDPSLICLIPFVANIRKIKKNLCPIPPYNASGTWNASLTNTWNVRRSSECIGFQDHQHPAIINQSGHLVTVVNDENDTYKGSVCGNRYITYLSQSEYLGTLTEILDLNLSSSTQVSGLFKWNWTDPNGNKNRCYGGGDILATKDISVSSFFDYFDNSFYGDNWTVIGSNGTVNESGSILRVQIPRPTSGCEFIDIDLNTPLSGQSIIVETRVAQYGKGGLYLRLKNDGLNLIELGFNTDDAPYLEFASKWGGFEQRQKIESSTPYLSSYNILKIIKTGNQYTAWVNGIQKGVAYMNEGIGFQNLTVELSNHTCSYKTSDSDNHFDYIQVIDN